MWVLSVQSEDKEEEGKGNKMPFSMCVCVCGGGGGAEVECRVQCTIKEHLQTAQLSWSRGNLITLELSGLLSARVL